MAVNDIFLYSGEANPNDIKLRDPTVADSGSSAALSGASSLTFTTTGVLQGEAALSGASSLTFVAAGNLAGSAALAAASSLTFTTTGNLAGNAALSGASTLTFATVGNLAGTAALSGGTNVTLTLVGSLAVSGEPDAPPVVSDGGGSGGGSALRRWRGWKRWRWVFRKEPEAITAAEVREVAREIDRADELLTREVAALNEAVARLAQIERLAPAIAELQRAIANAQIQRDEEDDDSAVLLLTVH